MLAYAHRGISAQRMLMVLVGDIKMPQAAKDLDSTLGTLVPDPEDSHRLEDFSGDLLDAPGARRLQANTLRERRLLMAWRVPPLSHPDKSLLQVVAQILGGGASSRLVRAVVVEKHLAKSLTVKLGIPGGRQTGLLVVEAVPEAEHALGELEQAIQGEVMRFQQEILPEDEIRKAQHLVEAEQLMVQEDAATLAAVIGAAQCEGGNWRLAFRGLQLARDFTPDEIRGVARRYLVSVQATTALLEPDPILNPQDRQEARLVRVLTQLLAPRLQDPAQTEAVIRETLRQIRMLPPGDQEKTQKLLEAQVKP
jgi:zinc protease